MITLKGNTVYLRALEPEDLSYVHQIENDEALWHVSETQTPFSVHAIKEYLENAHRDIYDVKQLRLAVCAVQSKSSIGLIDIFDFDARNLRAGIGIVIADANDRGKGYGKEALQLLMNYAKKHLQLHQLYANIGADNKKSIKLFESLDFVRIGIKKDWRRSENKFTDEFFYQHIL